MQGKLNQFQDGDAQKPRIEDVRTMFNFGDSPTREYGVIDNRGQQALVSTRLRDEHLFQKEQSYNFTKVYIKELRGAPDVIYIVEKEAGTVYEWSGDQLTSQNAVRTAPNGKEQIGLKLEYAAEWEDHAHQFMKPVRERVDG
jgi:hypothetical protein